jgi:hypothetical protein
LLLTFCLLTYRVSNKITYDGGQHIACLTV